MAIRLTSNTGKSKAAEPTPQPSPRGRRNAKGAIVEPEPVDNVQRLRENADDAARLARKVYITFLLIGTYIAVTIGSTTDLQLLKVSPVKLPILDVGLPIVGFYALVPWLLVLLHFNLLLLLYLLSRKLHLVDGAILALEPEREREEQRALLFPFPFSQMLIGRQKSWLVSLALNLVTWVTLIILPISLLIWAQVRFLPYHDLPVTWSQRATVILDLALVWAFWPMIVAPSGTWSTWLKNIFVGIWRAIKTSYTSLTKELPSLLRRAKALPGMLGQAKTALPGLLGQAKTALPGLLGRAKRFKWRRWRGNFPTVVIDWLNLYHTVVISPLRAIQRLQRALALVVITAVFGCFSLFIATVPGEPIETWAAEHSSFFADDGAAAKQSSSADDSADPLSRALTTALFDAPGAPFHRNLRLAEAVLVAGEPSAQTIQDLRAGDEAKREKALRKVAGLNFAKRDLRFADLRNALLPKANLRGVNLDGADLRRADLAATDFRPFDVTDGGTCVRNEPPESLNELEQETAGIRPTRKNGEFCLTSLERARLDRAFLIDARLPLARLQAADLRFARFQGADLRFAKLQGADLRGARLQGADLRSAQLQGADLRSAQLQRAVLYDAHLQGVNLFQARLQGARLFRAELQGADLRFARLQGADLDDARLQGADLLEAQLQGADLLEAQLQGADLRDAAIGGAKFKDADLSLADLRKVNRNPMTEKDYGELEERLVKEVSDEKLRDRILVTLKKAVDRLDNLEAAKAADGVLCEAPVLLPRKPCPSKQTVEHVRQYDKRLVDEVLRPLGCGEDADPAIALGLARRAVEISEFAAEFQADRPLGPLLASALLDPKCKGGAALPEERKAELRKIAPPKQAAEKP